MCENAHYDMIVKIAKVFFPSMIENIREKLKCRFFSSTIKLLQKKMNQDIETSPYIAKSGKARKKKTYNILSNICPNSIRT